MIVLCSTKVVNHARSSEMCNWLLESASRPLVGFGVSIDNLIKCLISFVKFISMMRTSIFGYNHSFR
jgi:hypothetical protein